MNDWVILMCLRKRREKWVASPHYLTRIEMSERRGFDDNFVNITVNVNCLKSSG